MTSASAGSAECKTISIVIPTLNSARYLRECLVSIRDQDYPKERIEIILADGGSTDGTIQIAKDLDVEKIIHNPKQTGEAGKSIGLKHAQGELVAFIDSDNVLVGQDWLSLMVEPFADQDIASCEALYWAYRKTDSFINRYCALSGVNDPLCLFLGNYDRYSYLTDRWTDLTLEQVDRGHYLEVWLGMDQIPTMGANGYIIRRNILNELKIGDYYFDIDVVHKLVLLGHHKIARAKVAIVHYFSDGIGKFIKKTKRRSADYFYYRSLGLRSYPWLGMSKIRLAKFCVSTILVLPLLWQAFRGFRRQADAAWFFHIPASWITLYIYAVDTTRALFKAQRMSRSDWSQ